MGVFLPKPKFNSRNKKHLDTYYVLTYSYIHIYMYIFIYTLKIVLNIINIQFLVIIKLVFSKKHDLKCTHALRVYLHILIYSSPRIFFLTKWGLM